MTKGFAHRWMIFGAQVTPPGASQMFVNSGDESTGTTGTRRGAC